MRNFLFFIFLAVIFSSCRDPLPVYFDKPIGTKVPGFDTLVEGNYIPLKDALYKLQEDFSKEYKIRYDKIIRNDNNAELQGGEKDMNLEDVKKIIGVNKDSAKINFDSKKCDSLLQAITDFNSLEVLKLAKNGSAKPVVGMIKFTYDRVFFIGLDSAGKSTKDTLFELSPDMLLTKYAEKYFLNLKTSYGWEILQLDVWENIFLSARPFYFTDYANCPKSIAELTASTQNIYPNMKPILNKEKKVIGYSASLNPKILLEKFKRSEEAILFLKIN
ncbi:MAG TPA: hypothetical protein VII99_08030 [Bacteroidia bacterium]